MKKAFFSKRSKVAYPRTGRHGFAVNRSSLIVSEASNFEPANLSQGISSSDAH